MKKLSELADIDKLSLKKLFAIKGGVMGMMASDSYASTRFPCTLQTCTTNGCVSNNCSTSSCQNFSCNSSSCITFTGPM